jgi:hypothetical protein
MLDRSLSSSSALSAFAEPFVKGRRVVVFGNALSALPRLMLERGARLVHVCDSTLLRATEAAQRYATSGLSFSALGDGDLALRDSSFDTVMVEHLGAFDAKTLVRRARKLLAPRGVSFFATPNREVHFPLLPTSEPGAAPLDYYALYDLVSAEFEHVRMFGQSPFVGYAVADFAAEGEIDPVIDSEFVPRGAEEPELFVALAARHRPSLNAYSLIQLPFRNVRAAIAPPAAEEKAGSATPTSLSLVQKLEAQEAWIAELEGRAETADARADEAETELENLREALARAEAQKRETPARVEIKAAPAPDPEALERTRAERAELERLRAERAELRAEAEHRRADHRELEQLRAQSDGFRMRISRLEEELAARDAELSARNAELAARVAELRDAEQASPNSDELAQLEAQLVERSTEIRRLERDLREAERIGRELLRDLERAVAAKASAAAPAEEAALAPAPVDTSAREALAARLALHAADEYALGWAAEAARTRAEQAEEEVARLSAELQQAEVSLAQAKSGQWADQGTSAGAPGAPDREAH